MLFFIDARPVAKGITWAFAFQGRVDEATVLQQCQDAVPAGYIVGLSGGRRDALNRLHVGTGDVVLVECSRRRTSVQQDESPDTDSDASSDSSGSGIRQPRHGCDSGRLGTSSSTGGTTGSAQVMAAPGRQALARAFASGVYDNAPADCQHMQPAGHLDRECPVAWEQFRCPQSRAAQARNSRCSFPMCLRWLLGGATALRSRAVHFEEAFAEDRGSFPADAFLPDGWPQPSAPSLFPRGGASDCDFTLRYNADLSGGSGGTWPVRPVPTPCRNAPCEQHRLPHANCLPVAADLQYCQVTGPTLLEEACALMQPSPFLEAALLIQTLLDHFMDVASARWRTPLRGRPHCRRSSFNGMILGRPCLLASPWSRFYRPHPFRPIAWNFRHCCRRGPALAPTSLPSLTGLILTSAPCSMIPMFR